MAVPVATVGLLLSGCGSIAASPGPGRPVSHAARSAGHGQGSAGSAAAASAARQAQTPAGAARAQTPAGAVLCRNLMVPLSVRIVAIRGPLVRPGSGGVGGVTGRGAGGVAESVSVTGAIARSVAEAVCAQPILRVIPICPPTLGYHLYRLTFTVAGRVRPAMIVRAAGCRQVTGPGPVRWMPAREPFLADLGRVGVVSRPGQP